MHGDLFGEFDWVWLTCTYFSLNRHKQYSPFGAKKYLDICPCTLSVPRREYRISSNKHRPRFSAALE